MRSSCSSFTIPRAEVQSPLTERRFTLLRIRLEGKRVLYPSKPINPQDRRLLVQVEFVPMPSPSLGRLRLSKKYLPTLWAGKWASSIKHLRLKRRTSNYFEPQRVKEQRSNLRTFFCRLCHTVDNLWSENQLKGKIKRNWRILRKAKQKMREQYEN